AFDKLQPNQAGTIYVDGVAQGAASTNASGYGAALVPKPATGFEHAVVWVGANGQAVIAPLLLLPAVGTPTNTPLPSSTGTPTACGQPAWVAGPTYTPGVYSQQGAVPADGNLYVVGGLDVMNTPVAHAARYNPISNTWADIPSP